MVVYYTKCEKCGPSEAYIGKTINSLYKRFYASGTGHLHPNNKDSPLIKHCLKTGDPECDFNFKNVKYWNADDMTKKYASLKVFF